MTQEKTIICFENPKIEMTIRQKYALASYLAEYIQEEIGLGISTHDINTSLVWQAIDAYLDNVALSPEND